MRGMTMSFLKLQQPRQFEYIPRYYKPENDPDRPRIQFRRIRHSKPPTRSSPLRLLLAALILLYTIIYLSRHAGNPTPELKKDATFQVEEIIVVE